MGEVLRTTSEPMVGAIRLAWWRERLQELGSARPPPEPRLQAAAEHVVGRGIAGFEIAALEDGWLRLFDPFPWGAATAGAIRQRGKLLFALGGRLLGERNQEIEDAGGLWALVDAARHCSDQASRSFLAGEARTIAGALSGVRFAARLRPLSMLALVAVRDLARGEPFEREGAPARIAAMLAHRLSGRIAVRD